MGFGIGTWNTDNVTALGRSLRKAFCEAAKDTNNRRSTSNFYKKQVVIISANGLFNRLTILKLSERLIQEFRCKIQVL